MKYFLLLLVSISALATTPPILNDGKTYQHCLTGQFIPSTATCPSQSPAQACMAALQPQIQACLALKPAPQPSSSPSPKAVH
jgi:hypothetical protein